MTDNTGLTIINLGWGVQSFTLAAMAALGELPPVDFAIHADTTFERSATYDFAERMTPWLEANGVRVVTVCNERDTRKLLNLDDEPELPAFTGEKGQLRRQCTNKWKIRPIRRFLRAELDRRGQTIAPGIVECWLGISLDEWQRAKDSDVKYVKNVFPLLDRRISRADCVAWLESHNLPVPNQSACCFCPYHSLAAWKAQKREGGG